MIGRRDCCRWHFRNTTRRTEQSDAHVTIARSHLLPLVPRHAYQLDVVQIAAMRRRMIATARTAAQFGHFAFLIGRARHCQLDFVVLMQLAAQIHVDQQYAIVDRLCKRRRRQRFFGAAAQINWTGSECQHAGDNRCALSNAVTHTARRKRCQLSLSTLQDMEARLTSLRSATAPHVGERASLASDTAPFHINLLEHAIEVLFRAYLSLCVQLKAGGTMPPSIRQVLESLDAIPPMLATFLPTLRFEITKHVGAQPPPAASGTQ